MVQRDGEDQEELRDYPHDGSPFNVVRGNAVRKVHLVYDEQRKDIVCGGLSGLLSLFESGNTKGRTWQFPAAKVTQAVQAHQATRKPKKRAYLGPALSAAQM